MNVEKISESEELIMSVIWESKVDLMVYNITDLVKERFDREWKPQTILTFLDRLKTKGFIDGYKGKNGYKRIYTFFKAKISKEEYLFARINEMQELWFSGSKEEMKRFIENIEE